MKMETEYKEEYGHISRNRSERIDDFIKTHNLGKFKTSIFDEIKRINSISWKEEKFIIYLLPKGTPRPRSTSKGSFFYVKGAKDNKTFFKKQLMNMEDLPYITTACEFECNSYFPIPKGMKAIEQLLAEYGFVRPISKPDWDNLGKTYSDMIQDIILDDDAFIIEGASRKYYSWKPRIEITIRYMTDYDSSFNKNKILKKGKK